MTSPSPGADIGPDLALLIQAAEAAGDIVKARFNRPVKTWSKGALGPVTEADLEANDALAAMLRPQRPDYGWLSEEGPEDPNRLGARRVFVLDPLDGTRAFLEGSQDFCVSLAIVEDGRPIAGVVRAPMTNETYAAALGAGARLNGQAIFASTRETLEDALLLGREGFYADRRWPLAFPKVRARRVQALAHRLALIARGAADGVAALGAKHEWDLAAGAILVAEAGGRISDPWGAPLVFNQPDPRAPGAVASGPNLHPLLLERTRLTPDPLPHRTGGAPA